MVDRNVRVSPLSDAVPVLADRTASHTWIAHHFLGVRRGHKKGREHARLLCGRLGPVWRESRGACLPRVRHRGGRGADVGLIDGRSLGRMMVVFLVVFLFPVLRLRHRVAGVPRGAGVGDHFNMPRSAHTQPPTGLPLLGFCALALRRWQMVCVRHPTPRPSTLNPT